VVVAEGCCGTELGIVHGDDEPTVTTCQHQGVRDLLADGVQVVILDDTHLRDEDLAASERLAASAGAAFRVVDHFLNVPIEDCISRDAARPAVERVGEQVIRSMFATRLAGSGTAS